MMTPRTMRRTVQKLLPPGVSGVGGVDTPGSLRGLCGRESRRGDRRDLPHHEARLARRQDPTARCDGAERGADGVSGKGAQALAAEIAIIAG